MRVLTGVLGTVTPRDRCRAYCPASEDDGFRQMMPDIAIEVASKSDAWATVKSKIDTYAVDGARHAIAIDPQTRGANERGRRPERLELDVAAIVDA